MGRNTGGNTMFSLSNFVKHPLTTLGGALVGTIQAGITAAAITYSQNPGQVTSWEPYAAAAATGAATFIIGGLLKDGNSKPEIAPQFENIVPGIASYTPTGGYVPNIPSSTTPFSVNPLVQQAVENAMTQAILDKLGTPEQAKLPNI